MIALLKIYVSYYIGEVFHIRRKPRTLQFPITSRCNSRCITCNIWKHHERNDVDPDKLKEIFKNSFFSRVTGVGVNGGEPTLHPQFLDVVKAVLTLPKLRSIAIISNCINSNKLLELLKNIYPLCKDKGVKLHLQISIDGIEEIHNEVRGIKVSFENAIKVVDELYKNREKYLDAFDIGCTISRKNVDYLAQEEEFFSSYDIPIYFHLAVPNKRIHNFDDAPFSVLNDKHSLQMAREFFFSRARMATQRIEKIRCTLIYLYLSRKIKKRLFICNYLYQDITINETLNTYLCATASEKVGSLKDGIPTYDKYNKQVKETKKHCATCIHYAGIPNLLGLVVYVKYKLQTYKWLLKYKNRI